MFKKTKQRIKNKIQSKIEEQVKLHDTWLIDKICLRIEYLACNTNLDLEQIFEDIKNGGYLLDDKEKCIKSN